MHHHPAVHTAGRPSTHRLHGHHVKHWVDGREASLDNLALLCPTHHRLVHEGRFDVQRLDDGAFRCTNPYGVAIRPPRRRETSSPDTIVLRNESLGLAIDCETATRHWHGERIDYDHALMASWDPGDTRPAVGPTVGDWNPQHGRIAGLTDGPPHVARGHDQVQWELDRRLVTMSSEVIPKRWCPMRFNLQGVEGP